MTATRNSWHVLEMATHVALVPDYEDGHVLAAWCWCQPTVETANPETGQAYAIPVIAHRDIGERTGGRPITDVDQPDDET
ncbi:hypothetical protein PAI11_37410 [Patulibacter medicamentivorans]|uniref:Uncharacterized protein n=1 Tax=Patulibacter medicamentivorans TaxID=1097667 RepID=H0EA67_9ACTN|nr:hypothetical protein [Patulibacter medicamentivorans]EHN09407.1 hypothetical protein PAI11_37410 [Patulibacter medicamentivorans]